MGRNLISILQAIRDARQPAPAAQPTPRAAAQLKGEKLIAASSVVFVSIFTETALFSLPFLRANIEQVGLRFGQFSVYP